MIQNINGVWIIDYSNDLLSRNKRKQNYEGLSKIAKEFKISILTSKQQERNENRKI